MKGETCMLRWGNIQTKKVFLTLGRKMLFKKVEWREFFSKFENKRNET